MRKIFLIFWILLLANKGFSANTEEVALEASWGTLRGTLWLPDTPTKTALLLIAGSGPTDRYGNSTAGIRTQAYALIAEGLQEAGYAVLSYDKRGIAASYYHNPEELMTDCRFSYFVEDAARWVEELRRRGFEQVILAGHSEGSLIALQVAEQDPEVAGVVSLCGAAWSLDQVLKMQLGAQLLIQNYSLYTSACRIIDTLKRGEEPSDIPAALTSLFPAYLNPFYQEVFQLNPQQIIRHLRSPILLIGGGHDGQVTPDNARTLKAAVPSAKLLIIEKMCHVLKDSDKRTATEQLDVYTNPSLPLSEELLPALIDFVRSLRQTE